MPGTDRKTRAIPCAGKGRRAAGAAAQTRQDQIRNLRCDQKVSAPMRRMERVGEATGKTGHRRAIQVLRKYRSQTRCPVLEKRVRVLRLEDRQGFQLYETRPPFHLPAATNPAPGCTPRKPLGGGRQLPFGVCSAVRRHGRRHARRACCTRLRREARRYSAAAGRFARRSVRRTVAAQAGRKPRRAYRTHHGAARCRGRSDGHRCDGTPTQDGRTEKKSQNETVTELENLKNHERRK